MPEVTAKFTTDVIGTCGFGIEINTVLDKDSEFRRIGKMIFLPTWNNSLRFKMKELFPWLYDMLSYIIPQTEVDHFIIRFVTEAMNYRETNNVIRHDFIDILREIKNNPDKMDDIKITQNLVAAQAFIFFAAGFETSSTTMSHALYELALDQQIQDKLREEINQEYTKHGSNSSYENVRKMNYLDKIFKETLRKYPVATHLMRHSTSSYTFGGSTVNIPKNLKVFIPVFGIHRDRDIYPRPDVFDPERLNDEAIQTRHPMHYLPFDDGPRNCIGARFGIHQTKIGLIKILRNYKVEVCDKTQIPYINNSKSLLLAPKDGIHLRIIKINQT
ncbi:Probable cytochrome P450 6a13 [Camponotus floridanus]|uniref:Probable cytochrome P450 6a13 n=1 Tax=Camponotus floridanus TaxID=104421 RepID=E1ZZL1_CAMFO|nr:Probable cytochrome P450 6a13 [Camponotus floridanus]